jgi:DNA repair exonuclease SbcCD ATPase subunit
MGRRKGVKNGQGRPKQKSRAVRYSEAQSKIEDAVSRLDSILEEIDSKEAEKIITLKADISSCINDAENAKCEFEELKDELQNWLDNLPENLQQSNKADMLNEAINNLDEAINYFDNISFDENDDLTESDVQAIKDELENMSQVEVEFPGMFS